MATDVDRLTSTARLAREEDLAVWIQPRRYGLPLPGIRRPGTALVPAPGQSRP